MQTRYQKSVNRLNKIVNLIESLDKKETKKSKNTPKRE